MYFNGCWEFQMLQLTMSGMENFIRFSSTFMSLLLIHFFSWEDFLWCGAVWSRLRGEMRINVVSYFLKINFRKKFNIFLMILHRYVRYTPVLMILILFFISPMKFLVFGPFSNHESLIENCDKYWWSTLLHISNYVNPNDMVFFFYYLID